MNCLSFENQMSRMISDCVANLSDQISALTEKNGKMDTKL